MAVRAVRGATTVNKNDANEIIEETKQLLAEMVEQNGMDQDDMISIIFTLTKDLDAAFPAVAARQLGWTEIALMCMNEIDVPGSLRKCIRVMIYFNTEKTNKEIQHIYRRDARILRPDLDN